MPDNSNRKYFVFVEVQRSGFAVKTCKRYYEAMELVKDIERYSEIYPYGDTVSLCNAFQRRGYLRYSINGNQVYVDNYDFGYCDGMMTVGVRKIDNKEFCIKTFMRLRENHSSVFTEKLNSNQKLERFNEQYYVDGGLIAN